MTLQQLEYALALRRYGSYGRAAKAVGISQPAMSIQIKKLEEEVSLLLFDRSQKKVKATYEGNLFLERAQLLVTDAHQLHNLAQSLREELSGSLRLGIIPTLAPYLIPLFIREVNTTYPTLKIHMEEALTEEIIQGIKVGTFDGGIVSTPIESKLMFTIVPLFYERFLLFVSEKHPLFQQKQVQVEEIPIEDLWLLKEGNCFRDQVDNICEIVKEQDSESLFYFESNSIESLCRIVEFKGGVTFLPELTTLQFGSEREEMIKKIKGPDRVRELSLLHLPNHGKKRAMSKLCEVIKENLPKRLLNKEGAIRVPTKIKVK
ncbi:MAG: LysR substrate-binding domain-containing protein [Bacteroidota bacterium]